MSTWELSVACLTGSHHRCTGVTHPEYIGGFGSCLCECHKPGGSES